MTEARGLEREDHALLKPDLGPGDDPRLLPAVCGCPPAPLEGGPPSTIRASCARGRGHCRLGASSPPL